MTATIVIFGIFFIYRVTAIIVIICFSSLYSFYSLYTYFFEASYATVPSVNIFTMFNHAHSGCFSFLVNTSIGCIHDWHSPVDEDNRQTMCTLCNLCCEHGSRCPYKGMACQRLRQSGCGTKVTGCKDCGICKSCANELWVRVTSLMLEPVSHRGPLVELYKV